MKSKQLIYKCFKESIKEWGGFLGIYSTLQFAFILLKFFNFIEWSWNLVLFPLWILAIIIISIIIDFIKKYSFIKKLKK